MNTQIKNESGEWVDGESVVGELYRRKIGVNGWHEQVHYILVE